MRPARCVARPKASTLGQGAFKFVLQFYQHNNRTEGEAMPPIAPREYFAELLEIGKSKAPQTERLQQTELVVEQFLSELEAANVGDVEAENHRARFIDLVSQAFIDPSTSEAAKLVLNHAYSLLTGNI